MGWGVSLNVSNCQKDVMCPIAHVPHCSCVKKMSSCQKDGKCQKVKHVDYGGGSQKKIDIMSFTHTDVKYEGHQNCSKTLSMYILRVFGDHHMWCQNWCQYLWTSLCQFIIFLWTSSKVYVFDFLTFETSFWHMSNGHMGNGHMGKVVSWLILQIEMGHLGQ